MGRVEQKKKNSSTSGRGEEAEPHFVVCEYGTAPSPSLCYPRPSSLTAHHPTPLAATAAASRPHLSTMTALPLGTSVADAQTQSDFMIKPENSGPKLDTSEWPLLLKNYVSTIALYLLQPSLIR